MKRDSRFYWIKWNNEKNLIVAEKRDCGKWYITGWDIEIEESKFTVIKKINPPEIQRTKG